MVYALSLCVVTLSRSLVPRHSFRSFIPMTGYAHVALDGKSRKIRESANRDFPSLSCYPFFEIHFQASARSRIVPDRAAKINFHEAAFRTERA